MEPIGPIGINSTYRANWARGTVTKNFVRLKIIILGQKISETFCPLLKFFVRSLYIAINARGRELCLTVILTKLP